MKILRKALNILILLSLLSAPAMADSIMFMDDSGNIHFVSSVSQIPEKYRPQVVKEPEVKMSPKEYEAQQKKLAREAEKAKKLAEKQKERDDKKKSREKKRNNKITKKQKRELKKIAGNTSIEDLE